LAPSPRVMYPVSPENVPIEANAPIEVVAGIGVMTSSVVCSVMENIEYSVAEYAKQTVSLSRNTTARGEWGRTDSYVMVQKLSSTNGAKTYRDFLCLTILPRVYDYLPPAPNYKLRHDRRDRCCPTSTITGGGVSHGRVNSE
jgi:hypothetical protein